MGCRCQTYPHAAKRKGSPDSDSPGGTKTHGGVGGEAVHPVVVESRLRDPCDPENDLTVIHMNIHGQKLPSLCSLA